MLGIAADNRPVRDKVVLPKGRSTLEDHMAFQNTAVADRDILLDDTKRPDLDVSADFRLGTDNRRRMNVHLDNL